jgi:hypothetical protein
MSPHPYNLVYRIAHLERDLEEVTAQRDEAMRQLKLATRLARRLAKLLPRHSCRLQIVDGALCLDGAPVAVEATAEGRSAVFAILADLLAHPLQWRTGAEIAEAAPMDVILDARHIGRHLKPLPDAVRALIQTNRKKGSRVVPDAWGR